MGLYKNKLKEQILAGGNPQIYGECQEEMDKVCDLVRSMAKAVKVQVIEKSPGKYFVGILNSETMEMASCPMENGEIAFQFVVNVSDTTNGLIGIEPFQPY